jgi:hypothetical protein
MSESIATPYRIAISFGSQEYAYSLARHTSEFEKSGLFQKVIGYTQKDLGKEFVQAHRSFFSKNKRGFGYWLWKPYLIWKTLETMEDGQTLIYSDAGCTLMLESTDKFREFIEDFEKSGKILNCASEGYCRLPILVKADLFHYMNIYDIDSYMNLPEIESGRLIFRKCPESIAFVKEWYRIGCDDNYHYIDDSPSKTPNVSLFHEHRHDQSILSLLCYTRGIIPFGDYKYIASYVWVATRERYDSTITENMSQSHSANQAI